MRKIFWVTLFIWLGGCDTAPESKFLENKAPEDRAQHSPETAVKAEQSLDLHSIYPMVREEPWPASGKVQVNSPWMLWSPPIAEKTGFDGYRYEPGYLYRGRLSMAADFTGPTTYTSPWREWTFFNRHQALKEGTWYWQYGKLNEQTGDETWSDPIAFTISGRERHFVVPAFADIKSNVPTGHPRVLATGEEIGKLAFPEPDRSHFIEKMRAEIDAQLPASLIYADQTVLAKKRAALDDASYYRFIDKRTKEIYRGHKRRLESIIKAYLITGEAVFRQTALSRFEYLESQYRTIVERKLNNDFTDGYFINLSASIYDNFYDYLSAEQRDTIRQRLVKVQRDTYHHFLHHPELVLFNSHTWQKHLTTFMLTSLILMHEVPEADTWFEYVYNLWSMRAPAMGNDGGWAPGNGYFDANKETLIIMPVLLGRLTGVNYFDHPWYRGAGAYFLYTATPGHLAGGFGDNADVKRENAADFIEVHSQITGDPYSRLYTDIVAGLGDPAARGVPKATDTESTLPIGLSENENLYWYMNRALPQWRRSGEAVNLSKGKVFPSTGAVGMHTHIDQPENNLSLVFRSSPFGGVGHTQASQNAFNIQYGGEPLFFRTGYYSSWADPHSLLSYRHTRAHNSILVDGKGQPFTPPGYGWMPRFASGQRLAYALGDASNAYSGTAHRNSVQRMLDRWQFALDEANGFGDPGLTRFRRHIAMVDDLIVIYDELAAQTPVQWSWLVKSRTGLSVDGNVYTATNSKGQGKLWLYSGDQLQSEVSDQFFSPPVDWLGNGAKRGVDYVNQWHGTSKTAQRQRSRFLAVIKVGPQGEALGQPQVVSEGTLTLDGWTISAELDAGQPAALNIAKPGVGAVDIGDSAVTFEGAEYPREVPGSTLLLEVGDSGVIRKEVVDTLPNAAVYR